LEASRKRGKALKPNFFDGGGFEGRPSTWEGRFGAERRREGRSVVFPALRVADDFFVAGGVEPVPAAKGGMRVAKRA